MVLAMVGDYLLGFGTFSTSSSPDAYMGITANVVPEPDWYIHTRTKGKQKKDRRVCGPFSLPFCREGKENRQTGRRKRGERFLKNTLVICRKWHIILVWQG